MVQFECNNGSVYGFQVPLPPRVDVAWIGADRERRPQFRLSFAMRAGNDLAFLVVPPRNVNRSITMRVWALLVAGIGHGNLFLLNLGLN